jgi:hypothetical protein
VSNDLMLKSCRKARCAGYNFVLWHDLTSGHVLTGINGSIAESRSVMPLDLIFSQRGRRVAHSKEEGLMSWRSDSRLHSWPGRLVAFSPDAGLMLPPIPDGPLTPSRQLLWWLRRLPLEEDGEGEEGQCDEQPCDVDAAPRLGPPRPGAEDEEAHGRDKPEHGGEQDEIHGGPELQYHAAAFSTITRLGRVLRASKYSCVCL